MNKIINGDFSDNFSEWDNGIGGLPYTLEDEQAKGSSNEFDSAELTYIMLQQFLSNEEIVTAKVSVWAKWEAVTGDVRTGRNRFVVKLRKPDATFVTLVDTTKDAVTGSDLILDESDIKAHMSQYGSYRLYLYLYTRPAWLSTEPDVYTQSFGWYDNINIDIAVKKYKTVHEIMGSTGRLGGKASVSVSEAVTLSESYSTEVFSPSYNYETASDIVGLNESYSTTLTRIHREDEAVGLSETIQAKRTQGNLETTYIIDELTAWDGISRVETPWIKEKVEIIGG